MNLVIKNKQIKNFFLIWESQGLRAAFDEARLHIRKRIYNRLGIPDLLRFYLDTDGRNTIFWALYKNIFTKKLELEIGEGIEIMSEDWDNLIILDAYRYDYFKKYSSLEGELRKVVSRGDHSHEFIKKNFRGEFWDTVVITANGYYEQSPFIFENTFFKIVNPLSHDVPGHRLVSNAAVEEIEKHPNKRVIIHYMSPHTPFEGPLAEGLVKPPWYSMYQMFRCGVIDKEILRKSYVETIRVIEQEIKYLLPHLEGKTVITSDHGENLGERQHGLTLLGHGHPSKECKIVPWLVIDSNERRVVQTDEPKPNKILSDYELNRRLEYLGYA
jgi:hypothetical protein